MAHIHTDFISIPEEVYSILLDILSENDGIIVYTDVSLREQEFLRRRLRSAGFHILERKYVK